MTEPMAGTSLSVMVPVPATPPTVRVSVSEGSTAVSSTVGAVIVKDDTPAGTVILPVAALKVTPLEKVKAL